MVSWWREPRTVTSDSTSDCGHQIGLEPRRRDAVYIEPEEMPVSNSVIQKELILLRTGAAIMDWTGRLCTVLCDRKCPGRF